MGELCLGSLGIDLRVGLRCLLRELVGNLVARVVPENVEDVALLDGLLHRVDVKRPGLVLLRSRLARVGEAPEQLERLALRGGGEGVVGEVRGGALGLDARGKHVLGAQREVFAVVLAGFLAQDCLHLVGGVARLRGVRFVGDDGVAAPLEADAVLDGLKDEGESLDRDDDDGRARLEGGGELLALAALTLVAVDLTDYAVVVLELVDGVLKLGVEDRAIGDDDHRVKDLLPRVVVEGRELVGRPRDGVALARPRAVLGEVLVAGAFEARGAEQLRDQVPLVIAREDEGLLLGFAALPVLGFLDLEVDEAPEDAEQALGGEHLPPQVVGGVAGLVLGHVVARRAVLSAAVEGQKARRGPGELGRHVRLVLTDGEVHEGAPLEAQ